MGSGKSTQTTQTNSVSAPWEPAQGPLQGLLSKAETLGNNTSLFTPQFSGATAAGVAGLEAAARQPGAGETYLSNILPGINAGFTAGVGELSSTAAGNNLNGNPYLMQVLDQAGADTANRVNQQFSAAGRYGSGAHSGTLAKEIGNQRINALMENYGQERAAQLNAANALYGGGFQGGAVAGALDDASLRDERLLLQSGGMRDQMEAATRTAPLSAAEWQRNQIVPIGAMGGENSGTSTTMTRQSPNIAGMLLGGAQMGLGLLSGNPFAAASGAGSTFGGLGLLGGAAAGSATANPFVYNWGRLG